MVGEWGVAAFLSPELCFLGSFLAAVGRKVISKSKTEPLHFLCNGSV